MIEFRNKFHDNLVYLKLEVIFDQKVNQKKFKKLDYPSSSLRRPTAKK